MKGRGGRDGKSGVLHGEVGRDVAWRWNGSGRRKWGMADDGGSLAMERGGEEAEICQKGEK